MPRQMPRYGIPRSRATWQARIFPSQPREPKPPGTRTPSTLLEQLGRLLVRHVLGVDPLHTHLRALVQAGVLERFVDREIGVVQLHVLADERDRDRLARFADAVDQILPLPELGRSGVDPELLANERVEAFLAQDRRNEIDVRDVGRGDDRADVDVGEEGNLVLDLLRPAPRASGRRSHRDGYRSGAAR